jgi:hypothetical protein
MFGYRPRTSRTLIMLNLAPSSAAAPDGYGFTCFVAFKFRIRSPSARTITWKRAHAGAARLLRCGYEEHSPQDVLSFQTSRAVHGGRVGIQQTLEMLDIFQARRAADHSVTEKLHQTSF